MGSLYLLQQIFHEGLNKMNQGAAVGISPGEQCPQHQEAERERQAVQRGTATPVHRPEKPAGYKHSSTSGLSAHEQLERQVEFHSSTQDET